MSSFSKFLFAHCGFVRKPSECTASLRAFRNTQRCSNVPFVIQRPPKKRSTTAQCFKQYKESKHLQNTTFYVTRNVYFHKIRDSQIWGHLYISRLHLVMIQKPICRLRLHLGAYHGSPQKPWQNMHKRWSISDIHPRDWTCMTDVLCHHYYFFCFHIFPLSSFIHGIG